MFLFADEDCVEEEGGERSSLCSSLCQETRTLKDMTQEVEYPNLWNCPSFWKDEIQTQEMNKQVNL